MKLYYDTENIQLHNQIKDIINDLNFKLQTLNSYLEVVTTASSILLKNSNHKNNNSSVHFLEEIKELSDKLKNQISSCKNMISESNSIKNDIYGDAFILTDEIKSKFDNFNNKVSSFEKKLTNIYISYYKFSNNYISQYISSSSIESSSILSNSSNSNKKKKKRRHKRRMKKNNILHNTSEKPEETLKDNAVLLISEKQQKVFLPYLVHDLNEKLDSNPNYSTIEEIIEAEYTVPLSNYSNPVISRFKEAYTLMRIKEKASLLDSLDLALEVSFNSLLNPAVITACKNLDEFDIYLDYLESDELDKFKIFKIQYEFMPLKV